MRVARVLLLSCLLLPMAGCLQADESADTPTLAGTSTGGISAAPGATKQTPAPTWSVGKSWVHKWTIGVADDLTLLVQTVVAEDKDGGWTLATDNQTIAAFHGAFIFPTLGHFSRDLLQTAGSNRFPWYHFPLEANKTWADTLILFDGEQDITYNIQGRVVSANYDYSEVYQIELTTDGRLLASYDYDSATQWFNEARFFDEEGDVVYRIEMQETVEGFKGRLYDDVGSSLLNHFSILVPPAAYAEPGLPQEFTMPAEQNRLLVFLFSFAAGGAQDSELLAPDGTRYNAFAADGVVAPIMDSSQILLAPGQAGTWRSAVGGAGAFASGSYVAAYGLQERVIDL